MPLAKQLLTVYWAIIRRAHVCPTFAVHVVAGKLRFSGQVCALHRVNALQLHSRALATRFCYQVVTPRVVSFVTTKSINQSFTWIGFGPRASLDELPFTTILRQANVKTDNSYLCVRCTTTANLHGQREVCCFLKDMHRANGVLWLAYTHTPQRS